MSETDEPADLTPDEILKRLLAACAARDPTSYSFLVGLLAGAAHRGNAEGTFVLPADPRFVASPDIVEVMAEATMRSMRAMLGIRHDWKTEPEKHKEAFRVGVRAALLRASEHLAAAEKTPPITCPTCGLTSYNPNDIREGYCGRCHDWTGKPAAP